MPDRSPQQRALIVDDNAEIAEMLAMLLGNNGYEVETAESAFEVLEKSQACDCDVIICDIAMPGMNGYELARKLRTFPACKQTVMIAMTGYSIYDDRGRARESGFDELVTKPIGPLSLIATIERLRKRKK